MPPWPKRGSHTACICHSQSLHELLRAHWATLAKSMLPDQQPLLPLNR